MSGKELKFRNCKELAAGWKIIPYNGNGRPHTQVGALSGDFLLINLMDMEQTCSYP
jgi:hypothetical protein